MPRLGILSDIHGNLAALRIAIARLASAGCDRLVCLGDLIGGGPDASACVDLVRSRCAITVRGNHDEDDAAEVGRADREWLLGLPEEAVESGVIFTHISPRVRKRKIASAQEAWNAFDDRAFDVAFIGHLHYPQVYRQQDPEALEAIGIPEPPSGRVSLAGARHIVCPGAVGYPRAGGRYIRCATYDLATRELRFLKAEGPLLPFGIGA